MIKALQYQSIPSVKGDLSVVGSKQIPFKVKRVFWINNVPSGTWRGGHAHKVCHQALFALSGLITITTDGGTYFLDGPMGFHVPPMNWIDICFRSSNATLLALASHDYDESDYIRKYEDYLNLLRPVQ